MAQLKNSKFDHEIECKVSLIRAYTRVGWFSTSRCYISETGRNIECIEAAINHR